MEVSKKTTYKPVNLAESDWAYYKSIAEALEAKTGYRVSLPALIRQGVNLVKEKENINIK